MEGGTEDRVARGSDFTIEHILHRAGERKEGEGRKEGSLRGDGFAPAAPFPWLQCTRYCPPKIPRKRDAPQKRQLGRHPRIPFTSHQLSVLEEKFQQSPYLSSEEVTRISRNLQLADVRVKIWFQNRRARERRERVLAEGAPVKSKSSDSSGPGVKDSVAEENQTNIFVPIARSSLLSSRSYQNALCLTEPRLTCNNT